MPMPPSAASSSVEGSGTAAGLPPKAAAGANAALLPPNDEPEDEPIDVLSTASRPEPESSSGEVPLDDQTDGLAATRPERDLPTGSRPSRGRSPPGVRSRRCGFQAAGPSRC